MARNKSDPMKVCGDKFCRRAGERLRSTQFPRNKNRPDGRNLYCNECSTRRVHQYRAKKKAQRLAQREARAKVVVPIQRKPNITAAERVTLAIQRGAKTREAIQRATRFNYDFLGDLLVQMIWDEKTIKIQRLSTGRRELVLSEAA